jgi:superfamily II DNA or RNA helicase
MNVIVKDRVYIDDPPPAFEEEAKKHLYTANPEYVSAVRFGSPFAPKPDRWLYGFVATQGEIILPRSWYYKFIHAAHHAPTVETSTKAAVFPDPLIEPYEHQIEAMSKVIDLVNANDADGKPTDTMVTMATSSGKTVLGMFLAHAIGYNTLIVVPTQEIEAAWVEDCQMVFGIKPDQIGRIRAGKMKVKPPFTVASIQTLMRRDPSLWAHEFGMTIYDEVHRLPGKVFVKALENCRSHVRLGLTATDKRKDGLMTVVQWHLGMPCHRDLKPRNSVPLVYCGVNTGTKIAPHSYDDEGKPEYEWTKLVTQLSENARRNEQIIELVWHILCAYKGSVLIVSSRVDHLKALHATLNQLVPSALLIGETKGRKELYAAIKADKYRITLATTSIGAEGASCPAWHHAVIATPFSDQKTAIQLKGRPIRKAPNKNYGYVWDLYDNVPMLKNMSKSRYNAIKIHSQHVRWFDITATLKEITGEAK